MRVGRDVAVAANEKAGAEPDGRNVVDLAVVSGRLKQDLSGAAVDDTNHGGLAVHREAFAV